MFSFSAVEAGEPAAARCQAATIEFAVVLCISTGNAQLYP
jgi:hypothetical protein